MANDDQIRQEVLAELAWDPRLTPSSVVVDVEDGIVTLSGWVDSFLKRWAADRAAFRIRDVRGVTNKIEVRLPPPSKRTDVEITDTASLALAANAGIATEPIDVSVQDGVLTLTGSVEWYFQRLDAERSVRGLWGVKDVINQITVRARPIIAELTKHIQHALKRSAPQGAHPISIEANGGNVVLKGSVRSWGERANAERVARSAPGVTGVDNQLVVTAHEEEDANG